MDATVTLALTSSLLFLILSSRLTVTFMKSMLSLNDDVSLIARTVVFGLLMIFVGRTI